jgi:hypothetical protein
MTPSGSLGVLDVDGVGDLPPGSVGWAAGNIAAARVCAEQAENKGLLVRALVVPYNVYPDGGTAYGYPLVHADVARPGVLT